MIEYIKAFLYDKATFASCMRGLVFAAGSVPEVVDLGAAGGPAWYIGKALQVLALVIRSSSATK